MLHVNTPVYVYVDLDTPEWRRQSVWLSAVAPTVVTVRAQFLVSRPASQSCAMLWTRLSLVRVYIVRSLMVNTIIGRLPGNPVHKRLARHDPEEIIGDRSAIGFLELRDVPLQLPRSVFLFAQEEDRQPEQTGLVRLHVPVELGVDDLHALGAAVNLDDNLMAAVAALPLEGGAVVWAAEILTGQRHVAVWLGGDAEQHDKALAVLPHKIPV
jgi:hypothetical protein